MEILPLLGIAGVAFGIGFSGAIMPGPLLTVVVNQVARRGFWMGPLAVGGHALAEVGIVAALLLGLGEVVGLVPVKASIALVGGAVLVVMAALMFKSLPGLSLAKETEAARKAGAGAVSVAHGILASISNPYWIIWWATVGLALLMQSWQYGALGIGFFYVGHIMSDVVWYSGVSASVALNRRLISDSVYRKIVVACAAALIAFGAVFIAAGVKFVL
jgi:threonine/homoserine/homoserine lactone efflux protein